MGGTGSGVLPGGGAEVGGVCALQGCRPEVVRQWSPSPQIIGLGHGNRCWVCLQAVALLLE
jgi:hypothetical protein